MENTACNINETIDAHMDGKWIFWPSEPDADFIESFRTLGQIVPALAVKEDGQIKIVAGYKRAVTANKLGISLKTIFIEADPVKRGIIYIQENSGRTIDDSMRLAAFRYFSSFMGTAQITEEIAPLLGVKPKSKDMKLWNAWLDLPEDFDDLLLSGSIPIAVASIINSFSTEERAAVRPFFESMNWSRSNAVNFLTWLYEASKYSDKNLVSIIEEERMQPRSADENPKEAVTRLAAQARSLRYPHLSGLETEFNDLSRGIVSNTGWKISSTGNFESGDCELSFRIRSRKDLERAVETLKDVSLDDDWDKLWNLGREK